MHLRVRVYVVMVLALTGALAATSSVAGAATSSGGQAAKKKACGEGKTRVKRKGRSSVCAKRCKAGYRHKVSKRGKVTCARRRSTKKPSPQGQGGPKAGNYSGTTAQSRPVTFTVVGRQIMNFQAGVNTYCSTPGNSRFNFDAIANVPPMAIGADGSFAYKGTSDQGNPEIAGKIAGGKATGTVGMSRGDSTYDASEGRVVFGSCSASGVAWSAAG